MGADWIGYTVIRPVKGADRIATKQIKKVKSILSSTKLSNDKKMDKLVEAGAELCFDEVDETLDADEYNSQYLEAMQGVLNEVSLEVEGRDLASRVVSVRGRKIEILSAGEATWGDEPSGYAYNILKNLVQLGISDAWEKALNK